MKAKALHLVLLIQLLTHARSDGSWLLYIIEVSLKSSARRNQLKHLFNGFTIIVEPEKRVHITSDKQKRIFTLHYIITNQPMLKSQPGKQSKYI